MSVPAASRKQLQGPPSPLGGEGSQLARSAIAVVLCLAACSRSHGATEPSPGGGDEPSPHERAERIADDLELAFERYYACQELPGDEDLWDGFARPCFTALLAEHLERGDALSACVRDTVTAYRSCGVDTPCGKLPCVSGTLLDDDPVLELIKEDCRGALDDDTRVQLFRRCR